MTPRIERLLDTLKVEKYPLCIEKFKIATQTLSATEGQPSVLRRAAIIKNILEKITIFIEDDELFAGAGASKPFGLEIDYEYGTWTPDEIESLKNENYIINPADEDEIQKINEKFSSETLISAMGAEFMKSEQLWPFMKSGVMLPPWKGAEGSGGGYAQSGLGLGPGFFLIGVDYEKMLNEGSLSLIAECEEALKIQEASETPDQEAVDFLNSVIIVHKALIRLAQRYSELAAEMAMEENDPERKLELMRISKACSKVPAKPAETFFEAIQCFWFTFLMINPATTAAAGRFDQYMYPFYKNDIEKGITTDEEVIELLELLRIKDIKLNRVSGQQNRKKNAGMAKWHNFIIGGVDKDGNDASNKLTYLLLDAAMETKIPHHTLTLRVHDKTPDELMVKALEVVKAGIGMPAFIGDKSYINFFHQYHGLPIEDARNYIVCGCLDGAIPGKSRTATFGFIVVALAFDIFMHNGFNKGTNETVGIKTGDVTQMSDFEAFKNAFYKQMDYFIELGVEKCNIELRAEQNLFPDPFRSSLMFDAVKEGKDILRRSIPFENSLSLCPVGGINVADSLAAVKKLVYEDKKYSMDELVKALDSDWVGFEEMQKDFLAVPKYGNGVDYVDELAAEVYEKFEKKLVSLRSFFGGKGIATAISITAHQPGGALTGATPDGRKRGEILADGSMSPNHGMDKNGPTGVLKSAMKINQDTYQATLLNMKFHPSALKSRADLLKLGSLIKTYFSQGGKHIQFNIVNKDDLIEAQAAPDEHQDLVVRVAGYSAYFTALGNDMQNEIIERTAFAEV